MSLFGCMDLHCFIFGKPTYLQLRLLVKALWVFYSQHCTYQLQNHCFQANVKIVNLIDYLTIRISIKCCHLLVENDWVIGVLNAYVISHTSLNTLEGTS